MGSRCRSLRASTRAATRPGGRRGSGRTASADPERGHAAGVFSAFGDIQDDALPAGKRVEYERLRRQVLETADQRGDGRAGRFALNLEIWLTGHAREHAFRSAGVTPGFAEYARLRRDASTVLPHCDLIERAAGAELPGALYLPGQVPGNRGRHRGRHVLDQRRPLAGRRAGGGRSDQLRPRPGTPARLGGRGAARRRPERGPGRRPGRGEAPAGRRAGRTGAAVRIRPSTTRSGWCAGVRAQGSRPPRLTPAGPGRAASG